MNTSFNYGIHSNASISPTQESPASVDNYYGISKKKLRETKMFNIEDYSQ